MKKTKKVLAALALSATLAMGAVPAFAADANVGEAGSFTPQSGDKKGDATTAVNVYATASQIQATIPVDITIVTPTTGGTITAPSASAYKIVNNGTAALKVASVQGAMSDDKKWNAVVSKSETITGTGELAMTVKAGSSAPKPIASLNPTDLANDAYFTVPAGGELGLTLAGTSYIGTTSLTADQTYPAIKIKYTVEVPTVS